MTKSIKATLALIILMVACFLAAVSKIIFTYLVGSLVLLVLLFALTMARHIFYEFFED